MKRGRHAEAPPERQDYLASVSDLMSGLIFIFIITLAVFSLRLAQAQHKLDDTEQKLRSADRVRHELLTELAERLDDAGIKVKVEPDQGVLRLTEATIQFPRGDAEPLQPGNVRMIARVLLDVLPNYVACLAPLVGEMPDASACKPREDHNPTVDTLLIEGHTDSAKILGASHFKDNLELSAARSSRVFRMMTQEYEPKLSGLLNRSGRRVLSVSGYGDTRRIYEDDLEDNDQAKANRRIDLRFLMELPREEPKPVEETRKELSS